MSIPDQTKAPACRTISELFTRAGVRVGGGSELAPVEITSLTDDSRQVERGSCFVAVCGTGIDGHGFVAEAVAAGAAVVVVDRDIPVPGPAVRVLVEDSRAALGKLAAAYYGLRGLPGQ